MASAGARAYNGSLEAERSPGAQPLLRGSGAKPPDAKSFFQCMERLKKEQICPILRTFSAQYARGRLHCVRYRNVHI